MRIISRTRAVARARSGDTYEIRKVAFSGRAYVPFYSPRSSSSDGARRWGGRRSQLKRVFSLVDVEESGVLNSRPHAKASSPGVSRPTKIIPLFASRAGAPRKRARAFEGVNSGVVANKLARKAAASGRKSRRGGIPFFTDDHAPIEG